MSRSDKKRRKAFLNEMCATFGIEDPNDPRRSEAAIAFIAYGEIQCRNWLRKSKHSIAIWAQQINIKQARKIVRQRRKAKVTRRARVIRKTASTVSSLQKRKLKSAASNGSFLYTTGADGAVTSWQPGNLERRLDRI